MNQPDIQLVIPDDMGIVREMYTEYQDFLGEDLCFQDFEAELDGLPGKYARPGGIILLALVNEAVADCVALRPLGEGVCEMKRMYVREDYRGLGLGRRLAEAVIRTAEQAGHRCMRLDTLERLDAAIALYDKLGFVRRDAYTFNPLSGVTFWEKDLEG